MEGQRGLTQQQILLQHQQQLGFLPLAPRLQQEQRAALGGNRPSALDPLNFPAALAAIPPVWEVMVGVVERAALGA